MTDEQFLSYWRGSVKDWDKHLAYWRKRVESGKFTSQYVDELIIAVRQHERSLHEVEYFQAKINARKAG